MSMFWICLLALSAGVNSQFSPSPPPTVFTTQMMPSSSGSTNGNVVAGSCAARVGSVCDFSMDACCNTMNFGVSIPPTFVQSLDCSKAKVIFNTLQSQSFTDSQCSSMKIDIELSGGTNCACMAAPTPPPKIEGPCTQRANGAAYVPCRFLPLDKTGCCPMEGGIAIPDPTSLGSIFLSCGVINATMFDTRSSNWTDAECFSIKEAIQNVGFENDGCVCPDSTKLDTLPPSQAPIAPSVPPTPAPTIQPTMSASSIVSSMVAFASTVIGLVLQAI